MFLKWQKYEIEGIFSVKLCVNFVKLCVNFVKLCVTSTCYTELHKVHTELLRELIILIEFQIT